MKKNLFAFFVFAFFSSPAFAIVCVPVSTMINGAYATAWYNYSTCTFGGANKVDAFLLSAAERSSALGAASSAQSALSGVYVLNGQVAQLRSDLTALQNQVAALSAGGTGAAVSTPPDPVELASFWSFAMVFTLGCWLLAKNAGLILSFIKRN